MTGRDTAWTLEEACQHFAEGGIPFTGGPAQLAAVIRHLPGLHAAGRTASGPKGGRGTKMYDIKTLMELHSALAKWL